MKHIFEVICHRLLNLIIIENIYLLKRDKSITKLQKIDNKYEIREVTERDLDKLKKYSNSRFESYYKKHMLPRINNNKWIGLAAIDTTNNEIAYLAWVVKQNVEFINEMGIRLNNNQMFLRDIFCVPSYRGQNINQRMMQERINYCINNGAHEIFIGILKANKKGIINVKEFGFRVYQKNYLKNIHGKKIIYKRLIS